MEPDDLNPNDLQLQPGTPEYDAAMIAKADEANPPAGDFAGFKSADELAKAYNELRTKMSQGGAPDDEPQGEPEEEAEELSTDEATKAAEAAGFDMAELTDEFVANGELSDDTYAKLEKAGFDRTVVDTYIAGQQALSEQVQGRVEAHVGGADVLQDMLEWAADGLSEAEARAFNTVVDTADEAGLKLALDGLKAKYEAANGSEPKLLGGGPSANAGPAFRSTAEVTRAMSDPRYATDPAYRADVEARLRNSDVF